jgi:DNA-directed RNA polymerase specialized sigma subunit
VGLLVGLEEYEGETDDGFFAFARYYVRDEVQLLIDTKAGAGPALVDAYIASRDRKERRALRTRIIEYYRSAVVRLVAGTEGTKDCRREATQCGLIGLWYALESFDGKGPFEEHAIACALRQVRKFLEGRGPVQS